MTSATRTTPMPSTAAAAAPPPPPSRCRCAVRHCRYAGTMAVALPITCWRIFPTPDVAFYINNLSTNTNLLVSRVPDAVSQFSSFALCTAKTGRPGNVERYKRERMLFPSTLSRPIPRYKKFDPSEREHITYKKIPPDQSPTVRRLKSPPRMIRTRSAPAIISCRYTPTKHVRFPKS